MNSLTEQQPSDQYRANQNLVTHQSIERQLKAAVEQGDLELPVLPAVAMQVLELSNDPEASAAALAKLVQSDPSLASHIMRVANSAAYSGTSQMQTLQQAIARLGMQQITQFALAMTVGEALFKSDQSSQTMIASLWRTSLATGAWAREVARLLRENTEMAFLCGLLHDIGRPVALHAVLDLQSASGLSDEQQLVELTERYHQVIGVSLARRWQLPEPVIETINYLDDYFAAPSAARIVTIVHAARQIAVAIDAAEQPAESADGKQFSIVSLNEPVFTELNLYEEDRLALDERVDMVDQLLAAMVL